MAEIVPNEQKYHKITLLDDDGKIEVILVGGHEPFLWIGDKCLIQSTVTGKKALRELAEAILRATD